MLLHSIFIITSVLITWLLQMKEALKRELAKPEWSSLKSLVSEQDMAVCWVCCVC